MNSNVIEGLAGRVNDYYARMRGTVAEDYDYSKAPVISDSRGHYTDAGKLPSHPTFSVGSDYSNSTTPGGVWAKAGDMETYTPSLWMMQQPGRIEGLARYMAEREPNTVLVMPAPYKQTDPVANDMLLRTKAGQEYAQAKIAEFEAQDKGLVDESDILGLAGAAGPIARSIKNYINASKPLYKPVNAGWGAFLLEQGIENGVQNQLQEKQ